MTFDQRRLTRPRMPEGGVGDQRRMRQVYFASLVGTTVEFYDFIIFGVAASLVFGQVFFASASPAVGTIASFATLAIGYAGRPLGGIIFGHFGDRIGRKTVLLWTMGIMGVSTFLIGCLPSSASIGSAAPILLVILRLLQGVAVGGEWGGAVLMSVEHAPTKRRGFFGGAAGLGSGLGTVIAYLVFGALSVLDDESFLAWGWRIPFLASIVMVGVGLYVRLKIEESPLFVSEQKRQASTEGPKRSIPIIALLRERPHRVLLAVGITAGPFMSQAILTTTLISYATTEYGVARDTMLGLLNVALVIMLFTIPLSSWLGDRIGRRNVYLFAGAGYGIFAFFMFPMASTGSSMTILLMFIIGMTILNGAGQGASGTLVSELFPTRFRYSGAGVSYQLSGLIGGGIGPLLASIFLAPDGAGPIAVALMLALFGVISAISVLSAGDTRKVDLQQA